MFESKPSIMLSVFLTMHQCFDTEVWPLKILCKNWLKAVFIRLDIQNLIPFVLVIITVQENNYYHAIYSVLIAKITTFLTNVHKIYIFKKFDTK